MYIFIFMWSLPTTSRNRGYDKRYITYPFTRIVPYDFCFSRRAKRSIDKTKGYYRTLAIFALGADSSQCGEGKKEDKRFRKFF